jgi:hypothetical protein
VGVERVTSNEQPAESNPKLGTRNPKLSFP